MQLIFISTSEWKWSYLIWGKSAASPKRHRLPKEYIKIGYWKKGFICWHSEVLKKPSSKANEEEWEAYNFKWVPTTQRMESTGAPELLVTTRGLELVAWLLEYTQSQSCSTHIFNCRCGVLAHILLELICSFSNLFQVRKQARGAGLLALITPDVHGSLLLFSLNPQLLCVCATACSSSGNPV